MKPSRRESALKDLIFNLSEFEKTGDPSLRHFAQALRGQYTLFRKIGQAGEKRGVSGIEGFFRSEGSPFEAGGADVYGGGKDRWYFYYWAALYPEKFVWNQKGMIGDPGFVLRDGEEIGEREKTIILSLLMSPPGRRLLFNKVIESIRARFGRRPPWPEEFARDMEILIGSVAVCPVCGSLFVGERKDQRFCQESCRKKTNAVPSSERKDQTAKIYFYRQLKKGLSRQDAWNATLARHGKTLAEIGLDSPKPPATWAKQRRIEHGT